MSTSFVFNCSFILNLVLINQQYGGQNKNCTAGLMQGDRFTGRQPDRRSLESWIKIVEEIILYIFYGRLYIELEFNPIVLNFNTNLFKS